MTRQRAGQALATRLDRLAALARPVGCEVCRGWSGVVLEGDDGPHRPERCAGCGRDVPFTLTVQIVGIRIAAI